MPSSDQIDCASSPSESRSRAAAAIAHGACTRAPNGVRMQTRQSPISSRKRSTTIVRSVGMAPVAASCSRRKTSRFRGRTLVQHVPAPVSRVERLRSWRARELARRAPDLLAELVRAADALALPERHRARHARRRRDEHAVAGDLLDPPGRGAEQEGLPGARLVDHLLVELADAAAAVDEVDAEEAAVGDRAGVRDREPARAVAPADRAAGAVPDDPRPQLGELVRGVAARRACRGRSRAARARGRRTDTRRGRGRAARRPRSPPAAQIATICCASTSSGLRGMHRLLDLPGEHPLARRPPTRAGRRGTSGRCGPSRSAPSSWPARPIRWRPRATDFGYSTWITRSTAPMSMPSSSDEVATRHGISPRLSSSSTSTRCSRAERAVVGAGDLASPPARSGAAPAARRAGGC